MIGGLLLDPVLGMRRTSIGITSGRVDGPWAAPATRTRWTAINVVLDAATAVLDARGMIVTPGGSTRHVHWLSPQVAAAVLAGGVYDAP